MADSPVVHIGENSAEQIAFKLLIRVGMAEKKTNSSGFPEQGTDRKWLLDTYAECIYAVKGSRP